MSGQYNINVEPNAKQILFFLAREKFILYGGAKGGGKSWCIRTKQILRRFRYPQTRGLIVRRTYPELLRNHIFKIREEWPMLHYNDQKHMFSFPNGSRLELGSAQNEGDILSYQGGEWEDIGIDQAEQFTEYQYDILRSCLRTINPDIKTQMYLGANPGGVGHGWIKRAFLSSDIDPDKRYIPAKVYDNPVLMTADPTYVLELEKLPEVLRRAYLEGDWTIFAGQVFNEFRLDRHIISSFNYPLSQCKKIIGFDWGYNAPGCAIWIALTPDGRIYVYREIYQNLKTPEQWANDIKIFTDNEPTDYIVLPHDCFANIQGTKSIADTFKERIGVPVRAGRTLQKNARKNRLAITHQYLSDAPDGLPYLQIHQNCINLIRTLPELIYDQHNPEDLDSGGEDHAYDALSIALMERVYQVIEARTIKFGGKTKKIEEHWAQLPNGEIQGFDFWKEFAKPKRHSTTAIEFKT